MACLLIKTIGRKEKNVFKIFANTKIIDFNHRSPFESLEHVADTRSVSLVVDDISSCSSL
jgi:hypothetical protein